MTTFWSRHLIIDREFPNDRSHVCDIIEADCFVGEEVFLLHFLNGLYPQVLKFFLAHTRKPLNGYMIFPLLHSVTIQGASQQFGPGLESGIVLSYNAKIHTNYNGL